MNLAIWDIESSSASTDFGSIIEIGGILVDENFKEKDRFNFRCRLPEGEIPQAMALIVNKTSVKQLTQGNLSHYQMLNEVEKVLTGAMVYCGRPDLTKTEILKCAKKDKGEWRKVAGDSLKHLVATGEIVKVGARYHHKNHRPKIVENDFTRNVFESLYSGPKSINAIVKKIGYDNTYGRRKVRQTLDFLVNEGLVVMNDYRWSQNGLD